MNQKIIERLLLGSALQGPTDATDGTLVRDLIETLPEFEAGRMASGFEVTLVQAMNGPDWVAPFTVGLNCFTAYRVFFPDDGASTAQSSTESDLQVDCDHIQCAAYLWERIRTSIRQDDGHDRLQAVRGLGILHHSQSIAYPRTIQGNSTTEEDRLWVLCDAGPNYISLDKLMQMEGAEPFSLLNLTSELLHLVNQFHQKTEALHRDLNLGTDFPLSLLLTLKRVHVSVHTREKVKIWVPFATLSHTTNYLNSHRQWFPGDSFLTLEQDSSVDRSQNMSSFEDLANTKESIHTLKKIQDIRSIAYILRKLMNRYTTHEWQKRELEGMINDLCQSNPGDIEAILQKIDNVSKRTIRNITPPKKANMNYNFSNLDPDIPQIEYTKWVAGLLNLASKKPAEALEDWKDVQFNKKTIIPALSHYLLFCMFPAKKHQKVLCPVIIYLRDVLSSSSVSKVTSTRSLLNTLCEVVKLQNNTAASLASVLLDLLDFFYGELGGVPIRPPSTLSDSIHGSNSSHNSIDYTANALCVWVQAEITLRHAHKTNLNMNKLVAMAKNLSDMLHSGNNGIIQSIRWPVLYDILARILQYLPFNPLNASNQRQNLGYIEDLYRTAMQMGYTPSCTNLARFLSTQVVNQNAFSQMSEVNQLLVWAASRGDSYAQSKIIPYLHTESLSYSREQHPHLYHASQQLLTELIENVKTSSDSDALYSFAVCLHLDDSLEKRFGFSDQEIPKILEKARSVPIVNPGSPFMLSFYLQEQAALSSGSARENTKLSFLMDSWNRGIVEAAVPIAQHYYPSDISLTKRWLSYAMAYHIPAAFLHMATICERLGEGKSFEYYKEGAMHGNADCSYRIAVAYEAGHFGLDIDTNKALDYYRAAAVLTHPGAIAAIKRLV